MARNVVYKGFRINSAPSKLQRGDFSTKGSIDQCTGQGTRVNLLNELQARTFSTEEEADEWFIRKSKLLLMKYFLTGTLLYKTNDFNQRICLDRGATNSNYIGWSYINLFW